MQICDGCGQDVDGGEDTCPNCGEDLAPPRTDSQTPVENEKPTDTATNNSLLAALWLGIVSWIFLQFALNLRIWLDYCESTTFFWLFIFCVAGAVASLLRKFYLVALSSAVTVTLAGIILLFPAGYFQPGFISMGLIFLGILGTLILVSSRSEFKSQPKPDPELGEGEGVSKRFHTGETVKKVLAVLIVVVVLTLVYFSYGDCDYADRREGYYEVRVSTASGVHYELIVPVPVKSPLVVWDLVNSTEMMNGSGSWEVVQTSFGPGFRITGSGNVTLRCEELKEATTFHFLSPQNRSQSEWGRGWEMPFLVFADASGSENALELSVVADYHSAWGGVTTTLESEPGDLVGGWQVVWGDQDEWEH